MVLLGAACAFEHCAAPSLREARIQSRGNSTVLYVDLLKIDLLAIVTAAPDLTHRSNVQLRHERVREITEGDLKSLHNT